MKKYHLADVLTLGEGVFALLLLGATIWGFEADVALWLFVAGEVCDAFDGMCARRWHYPEDGKYRWWRGTTTLLGQTKEVAPLLDQVTDIMLAIGCALYLLVRVEMFREQASVMIFVASSFAMIVQVLGVVYENNIVKRLIMLNRYIYLGAIAGAIIMLIFATGWTTWWKYTAVVVGVVIACILIVVKWNRLTQIKTPL